MDEVQKVLQNPLVRTGLKTVAPQVALGVDLAVTVVGGLFGSRKRKPSAAKLMAVIDKQLAKVLEDLATTESKHYRNECEIRAHTLLGVLMEWDRIK
ncbi:MAG: hypothetical protein K5880_13875 [Hydrogenophaga sp.]|uniref:hypothetical protein n=1 Tax=Hydrogenophaga sp. TaxID=1904254 RepID=UPI00261FC9E2|nr:hypothetical protein [Hydrogenophaga sp.]MCV0439710.1 hypothetical protein [Hydrogenophaga sp.]